MQVFSNHGLASLQLRLQLRQPVVWRHRLPRHYRKQAGSDIRHCRDITTGATSHQMTESRVQVLDTSYKEVFRGRSDGSVDGICAVDDVVDMKLTTIRTRTLVE